MRFKTGIYINPYNGYCYYNTAKNRKRLVHRVIWEKYHGEIPKGYIIHHRDKNKQNNNIKNLELVFYKNHRGKYHKDCNSKLTEENIEKIKQLKDKGFSVGKEIAPLFGVSRRTIYNHLKIA